MRRLGNELGRVGGWIVGESRGELGRVGRGIRIADGDVWKEVMQGRQEEGVEVLHAPQSWSGVRVIYAVGLSGFQHLLDQANPPLPRLIDRMCKCSQMMVSDKDCVV